MRFVSDLHVHSKYSRACSPRMDAAGLAECAKVKGLNLLGTGDFTHPKYLAELKRDLKDEGNGFYKHADVFFILTVEVSNVFTQGGRGRRVHNVITAPGFDVVNQLNEGFTRWGRLDYDGRPFLNCSCAELAEFVTQTSKDCLVIPAHIFTPWYGLFGSKSGFDSLADCFQDQAKNIHAIETGMSSDPAMNWRLSELDDKAIVSFSDAHSAQPWRLGREATVFELDKPSYFELVQAVQNKNKHKISLTIETQPAYGKYHWDGHRDCKFSCPPEETKKLGGVCPVCKKPLTIGVANRVEELADRPLGFVPKGASPFKALIPLSEIIAASRGISLESVVVKSEHSRLMKEFGNELAVLLDVPKEKLAKFANERLAQLIILNRAGLLEVKPGFDGEYGRLVIDEEESAGEENKKPKSWKSQKKLEEW